MVAVLDKEGTAVDVLVHRVARRSPVGEVRHGLWDIAAARGTEIVEHGVGVFVGRPAAAWRALIDGVLPDGMLAEFIFPEAVHHLGTELEPTLQLESHGGDGMVVEVGVGRRRALVVEVFLDHVVHLVVVASRDAAYDDLGHGIVAQHRIGVVRDVRIVAVAARMVVHGVGYDALCAVGVMVAQEEHGRRRHVPCIVGIADEVLEGRIVVAAALRNGKDLGGNALVGPELLDAVGQRNEVFVVGGDDHVFATRLAVLVVLAKALAVVHLGQCVPIEDEVLKDLVPLGGAIADVAIGAVAAFHVQLELHVAINDEFLGHRVVLEGHHTQLYHLHATYGAYLRKLEGRFGIEGVATINAGVFLVNGRGVVVVQLGHSRWDKVNVADDLGLGCDHRQRGRGAIGDGDEGAAARKVGGTSYIGEVDAREGDGLPLHFGAVGVFDGDGTEVVLYGQLAVVSIADAEPVGLAVEAVFLCL